MNKLLHNNCIMSVLFDDHTKSTGRIDFYGGEVYYGEIHEDLPKGHGTLIMTDSSRYEGDFDKNGLINGEYIHFTQNKFIGTFSQDRLKSGKIEFRDGDVFKGVWTINRGKWVLSQGTLFDEDQNKVGSFDSDGKIMQIRSKLKELFKNDTDKGFCIKYDYFVDFDSKTYQTMIISSHGYSLTKEVNGGLYTIEKEKSFALIPYEKSTIVTQEKQETVYKLPYGFEFSILKKKEIGTLKFDHVQGIHAEGFFNFNEKRIHFSGKLIKETVVVGKLEIKKSIFSKLSILLDDRELRDLRSFYITIVELTNHRKYLPGKSGVDRKLQEVNKNALGNIIEGIKQENECQIF